MEKFQIQTRRGFSLLELLIVIALIAIIGTIGASFYINYGKTVEINSLSQTMIFDLKSAQSKAMTGEGELKYGIHFVNGASDYYEIFSTPTDYSDGAKATLSTNYLTNNVTFSEPTEGNNKDIIFNKISGGTSDCIATNPCIEIISQNNTKKINVSSIGSISSE